MMKLFAPKQPDASHETANTGRRRRGLAAALALSVAVGIATFGGAAQHTHAQTPPTSQTFYIGVECSGRGQVCDSTYKTTIRTATTLRYEFTASPQHCSDISVVVLVDGALSELSPFLQPGGSTGLIDASPVAPGAHTLEVQAQGRAGGCNDDALYSWAGTLRVETGQVAAVTTTHAIGQTCSGASQLCEPYTRFDVTTNGLLQVEYIASSQHCSDVQVQVFVDFGPNKVTTPFLSANQSSGVLDLGAVSPGHHNLYVKATGRVGGCNTGYLGSWGGTLNVTTN